MLTTWLSYRDLTELVRCCLFAPELGHTVVYGMSANRDIWWDNSKAAHLGFHAAGQLRAVSRQGRGPAPGGSQPIPRAVYQGGAFVRSGPVRDALSADAAKRNWFSMPAMPSAKARSGWRRSRRCTGSTSPRASCIAGGGRRPRRQWAAPKWWAASRRAPGRRLDCAWRPACSGCRPAATACSKAKGWRRWNTPAPACASTTAAATARAASGRHDADGHGAGASASGVLYGLEANGELESHPDRTSSCPTAWPSAPTAAPCT